MQRVGQAVGSRLDHLDRRLQIGPLRIEQQQDVCVASLHLLAREIKADFGSALEVSRRF